MNYFEKAVEKLISYGVELNEDDELKIRLSINSLKGEIVNYCNLSEYPENVIGLDNILVQLLVANFLKIKIGALDSIDASRSPINKENIESMSIGDFSITYGSKNTVQIDNKTFIEDEISRIYNNLNKYRRITF